MKCYNISIRWLGYDTNPTQHTWTITTHYSTGSATTCTDAYKPFKTPQHASSSTQKGASTSCPSCSSYMGFQSTNVCNSRLPYWCTRHCTISFLRIRYKIATSVCHWMPTTAFVGHRHVPSAANQHTSWRSLICCCWASCMEQSANPAARVGQYTWTISTSTQNTSMVTDSCSAEWQCFVCTVYKFAYLHTYLIYVTACARYVSSG